MVGGLASRARAVDFGLNAVVAHAAYADGAALHEEVFAGVYAVACCLQHVDGAVLHAHVFAGLDAVLQQAVDIQCALALELGMALHDEAGFLRAAGGIGQRVLRVLLHADVYALAVLNVDGRTAIDGRGVGQCQSVQLYGGLVRARQVELAVGRAARERIGDFAHVVGTHVGALFNAYVRSADGGSDVLRHVSCHIDGSGIVVVAHAHGVVAHLGLVYVGLLDVCHREGLAHDGERGAFAIVHVAHLGSGKLVDGVAHHHVHRLCLCCDGQHEGSYHCCELLHFTVIFRVLVFVFIT